MDTHGIKMRSVTTTTTTVLWLLSLLFAVTVASHKVPDVPLVRSATTRNSSSQHSLLLWRNQRRRRSKEDDKKSDKNTPTPTLSPTVEQKKSDTTKTTKEKLENTESPVAAPKESSFSDAVLENENDIASDDGVDVVVFSEQEEEEVADRNNNNKEAKATPSPTIPALPRQANPAAQPIALPPFFAGFTLAPAVLVPVVVTPAPVPVVTPAPVPAAVPAPVVVPVPVVVPTTMAPVSEATPAPQIVNVTTSPTPMMDSESPSVVPSAMPNLTTDAPVTEPPSDTPSLAPVVAVSEMPSIVPSTVPSMTPTLAFTVVNITLQGVFEIQYPNVSSTELSTNETGLLETITEEWFQNYYNNVTAGMELELMLIDVANSTVRKFRNMQVTENTTTTDTNTTTNTTTRTIQVFIEDMVTNITINSQNITPSSVLSNPTYKNVVQYQQQLQYRYFLMKDGENINTADGRAGTDDDHDNSTTSDKSMDNIIAQVLAVQPFLPVESSKEYQMLVATNILPFASVGDIGPPKFTSDDVVPTAAPILVGVPVPVPVPLPVAVPTPTAPTVAKDKSLSSAAIAGISVGGLVIIGLLLYGLVILPYDYKRATTANAAPVTDMDQNDMGDGDAAMVAANTTPVKDSSTSRKLALEQETAAMMNKSIITKQQSYGAEETSTLGGFSANQDDIPDDGASYEGKSIDTTEFDYAKVAGAGVIGGAAAAAALAAGDSDIPSDDNQFVIYAPAGKLGLVVDNPDDGAPVVHAIKEDSVLIGQVHVGDRLIGVDEVDVRTLSPVKVSKLISKRSSNPLRKLTLVRGKPDYDEYDTGTDGGDTASHTVDTASHFPEEEEGAASSENLGIPPNPPPMNDDETSHVESMSRLSGDEDNDDDDEEENEEENEEDEEVEEEEESVMDYPDDTSSVVDAMSHTSGLSGIPPVTVDETKTDDGNDVATTQVGEGTSEQSQ